MPRPRGARRSVVLCAHAARLSTDSLRRALRAQPLANRWELERAAAERGPAVSAFVDHLLRGDTSGKGRPRRSTGVRLGIPLVATLLGGGRQACVDLENGNDRPGVLGPRVQRAWRQLSRRQLGAFAAHHPGGRALVNTLEQFAHGAIGVRSAAWQESLRYLCLALVYGGLSGLGVASRTLAHLGHVSVVLEARDDEHAPAPALAFAAPAFEPAGHEVAAPAVHRPAAVAIGPRPAPGATFVAPAPGPVSPHAAAPRTVAARRPEIVARLGGMPWPVVAARPRPGERGRSGAPGVAVAALAPPVGPGAAGPAPWALERACGRSYSPRALVPPPPLSAVRTGAAAEHEPAHPLLRAAKRLGPPPPPGRPTGDEILLEAATGLLQLGVG